MGKEKRMNRFSKLLLVLLSAERPRPPSRDRLPQHRLLTVSLHRFRRS